MSKMSELDVVIADLRKAAEIICDAANELMRLSSGEVAPSKPAEPTKPVLTLPEVRAILAEKSRAGHTAEIKALLVKYGAEKLSAIDPSQYEALLAEAEVL